MAITIFSLIALLMVLGIIASKIMKAGKIKEQHKNMEEIYESINKANDAKRDTALLKRMRKKHTRDK